jgi:riboflavin kinase/FMN adenylyltransferase
VEIKYLGINEIPQFKKPLSLALGYFDGLHLGHINLIKKTLEVAKKQQLASAMITFEPNPLITLNKIKEEQVLTTIDDRLEILETLGVDYIIVLKFTKEVAGLLPEQFINQLIKPMNVKALVCGFDYYFGKNNQGDSTTLLNLSQGDYQVYVIDKVINVQEKISSSRIIALLQYGNVEKANELLNRNYSIKGQVITGKQIGRQLGFPTANIDYYPYVLPKRGVYGVKVIINNKIYIGMCNIGINPTIGELNKKSMEVNIFDFNEDIYHKTIKVYFYFFVRDEMKFSSKEELIQQLSQDKENIFTDKRLQ